jgi:hypothetical protein
MKKSQRMMNSGPDRVRRRVSTALLAGAGSAPLRRA